MVAENLRFVKLKKKLISKSLNHAVRELLAMHGEGPFEVAAVADEKVTVSTPTGEKTLPQFYFEDYSFEDCGI